MRCEAACGLAVVLFLAAFSAVAAAQCGSVKRDSPEAVKMEVNRLFNKTLDAMEYTLPSGEKVTTWMGWEPSTQDQIKCLGNAAVLATAELLRSTRRSFGHILAVLMLGSAMGIFRQLIQFATSRPTGGYLTEGRCRRYLRGK